MADCYSAARSNYFKVKDIKKFQALCGELGVKMITKDDKVGFLCSLEDGTACLPTHMYSEEVGDNIEIDLCAEVAKHLVAGEVAVFVESGHEKFCYVYGSAMAVNSKGKICYVDTNNIYALAAKKLGEKKLTPATISRAEY